MPWRSRELCPAAQFNRTSIVIEINYIDIINKRIFLTKKIGNHVHEQLVPQAESPRSPTTTQQKQRRHDVHKRQLSEKRDKVRWRWLGTGRQGGRGRNSSITATRNFWTPYDRSTATQQQDNIGMCIEIKEKGRTWRHAVSSKATRNS